jgi:hypothetical protein
MDNVKNDFYYTKRILKSIEAASRLDDDGQTHLSYIEQNSLSNN